jgi:hypothetical protein
LAYQVVVKSSVEKDLRALDKAMQVRIYKFIQKLETVANPESLLLPYSANLAGYCKKRIADYRCKPPHRRLKNLIATRALRLHCQPSRSLCSALQQLFV